MKIGECFPSSASPVDPDCHGAMSRFGSKVQIAEEPQDRDILQRGNCWGPGRRTWWENGRKMMGKPSTCWMVDRLIMNHDFPAQNGHNCREINCFHVNCVSWERKANVFQ